LYNSTTDFPKTWKTLKRILIQGPTKARPNLEPADVIFVDDLFHPDLLKNLKENYIQVEPYLYKCSFVKIGMIYLEILKSEEIISNHKNLNNYYDIVVLARIDCTVKEYEQLIFEHYPKEKIVIIDGHDGGYIYPEHLPLINKGLYFKRELVDLNPVNPISFAIPREKCLTEFPNKIRALSNVRPGDGYIHSTEDAYYQDYAESLFGITYKKGGWDCMRHYEIMANRCVPYFADLEKAPANVMTTLPKNLLLYIKQRVEQMGPDYFLPSNPGWTEYVGFENKLHSHFINNCTTDILAQYVLSKV
jgi:hypothetical protein